MTDPASHRSRLDVEKREEMYRNSLENQTEMLCRFRPEGTILFANAAYARARGVEPGRLDGANFWNYIPESDRAGVREMLDSLRPEAPESRVENRFETTSGVRWILWINRAISFDGRGRLTEVQSTGIDITDRKRLDAERQTFFFLAEQNTEFIGISDTSLRPFYVNPAGLQLMGLESVEQASRMSVLDFFFPEDRTHVERLFETIRRQGHVANEESHHRSA